MVVVVETARVSHTLNRPGHARGQRFFIKLVQRRARTPSPKTVKPSSVPAVQRDQQEPRRRTRKLPSPHPFFPTPGTAGGRSDDCAGDNNTRRLRHRGGRPSRAGPPPPPAMSASSPSPLAASSCPPRLAGRGRRERVPRRPRQPHPRVTAWQGTAGARAVDKCPRKLLAASPETECSVPVGLHLRPGSGACWCGGVWWCVVVCGVVSDTHSRSETPMSTSHHELFGKITVPSPLGVKLPATPTPLTLDDTQ